MRDAAVVAVNSPIPTVGGAGACGAENGRAETRARAGPLLSTTAEVSGVYLLLNIFRPNFSTFVAEAFDPATNTAFVVSGRDARTAA